MNWQIIEGDCREQLARLDPESVQTCVTSPPYWGLRDYGTDGQLGLEPTPEEYVANLVEVFREVRRVLRDDGTVWLNLGDSYAGSWGAQSRGDTTTGFNARWSGGAWSEEGKQAETHGQKPTMSDTQIKADPKGTHAGSWVKDHATLKPKDLVGIPWRVAFALQADGWWLRSDIIWSKPNPMPESVTDRPTRAHEYVFLLSKASRYFYDNEAIKEASDGRTHHDLTGSGYSPPGQTPQNGNRKQDAIGAQQLAARGGDRSSGFNDRYFGKPAPATRNRRSVWEIATQPYSEAHFATFPPKLVEPCVLAGSPPKCCGECGAPWVRLSESEVVGKKHVERLRNVGGRTDGYTRTKASGGLPPVKRTTTGWKATCYHAPSTCSECDGAGGRTVAGPDEFGNYDGEECEVCGGSGVENAEPNDSGRSVVLDPFAGAGTTGLVALRHNRSFIGIELNPTYAEMARNRIRDDAPLLNTPSELAA